jgi:dTDP-4-dehydrorhamnose 3,5-epimerase
VRCAAGRFLDVVVDVRQGSPTYGNSLSIELTAEKGEQLYIPEGFAHGFVTLVPNTEIFYKVSSPYAPKSDGGIHWNDPSLGINWPLPATGPITSPKDQQLPLLSGLAKSFTYDGIPLSLKRVSL